jgi:hypothetical protein
VRPLFGSKEFISCSPRACLWITLDNFEAASLIPDVAARIEAVRETRLRKASDVQAQKLATTPYRFRDQYEAASVLLIVPIVSSSARRNR